MDVPTADRQIDQQIDQQTTNNFKGRAPQVFAGHRNLPVSETGGHAGKMYMRICI